MASKPNYGDASDVARRGVPGLTSIQVVRRLAAAGIFPPGVVSRPNGRWVFLLDRFDAWIASGARLADEPKAQGAGGGGR
jgi:hypothetical protein